MTTTYQGRSNGLIVNSALRASLSPEKLRLSVIVHKFNHSHDMIFGAGAFTAHLLRSDQLDIVEALGMRSGRDGDKLATLPHVRGALGTPVLKECLAYYECEVVNVMDTGASTFFLGAAKAWGGEGAGQAMMSQHVRMSVPPERQAQYDADLLAGQEFSTRKAEEIAPVVWRGFESGGA
ncbi:MAG: flavin reductase [Actinobacteria bacterium]|nr:flavin reductase [Actinomycetota bacterium]